MVFPEKVDVVFFGRDVVGVWFSINVRIIVTKDNVMDGVVTKVVV